MNISSYEKGDVLILVLSGDLKGGNETNEAKCMLLNFLKESKRSVVIDLSDVKYASSSGIAMLISCYKLMINSGGNLKLASLTEKLNRILAFTKLNQIFETYDNVDTAINSFKSEILK